MGQLNLKTKKQFVNVVDKILFVTKVQHYSTISEKALIEAASRNSGINRGLIQSATDAISNEFRNFLMNGHAVKVPFIGTFRITMVGKAVNAMTYTDEKTGDTKGHNAKTIVQRLHVIFLPSTELKQLVDDIEIKMSVQQ